MPLVLYGTAASPPCRSVFMVIKYLNLTVEHKEVYPMNGDALKPEYLKKNHLHTIPFLEDDGFSVTDSHAIMTYLVSKYGKVKDQLYPSELKVRTAIDQRLHLDGSILYPKFITAFTKVLTDKLTALPENHVKSIEEMYGFLEEYLERSKFLAADHITLADIAVVAIVSSSNVMVPIGKQFPQVLTWWNKLKEQDWYQKGNSEGLAAFESLWKKTIAEGSK